MKKTEPEGTLFKDEPSQETNEIPADLDFLDVPDVEVIEAIPVEKPVAVELPERHYSHSQVNCFRLCPRKYYYHYCLGIKEANNGALCFGNAIHFAMENMMREKKFSKGPDLFMSQFEHLKGDVDWKKEDFPANYMAGMGKALISQPEVKDMVDRIEPVNIEKGIGCIIDDFKIVGYIDLVGMDEGKLRIFDYKTKGKKFSENALSLSTQLGLYARITGIKNVGYVNFVKSKKPCIQKLNYTFNDAEMDGIFGVFIRTVKHLDGLNQVFEKTRSADLFPPLAPLADEMNWICGYCSYSEQCKKDIGCKIQFQKLSDDQIGKRSGKEEVEV